MPDLVVGPGIYHWFDYLSQWTGMPIWVYASGSVPGHYGPGPGPIPPEIPHPTDERYVGTLMAPFRLYAPCTYWWWLENPFGTFSMQDGDPLSAYWPVPPTYQTDTVFCMQYKGTATFQVQYQYGVNSEKHVDFGSYTVSSNSWEHLLGNSAVIEQNLASENTGGYYDEGQITMTSGHMEIYQAAFVERCGAMKERKPVLGTPGTRQVTFQQ